MRILILLSMIASLLGCSYDLDQMEQSKKACADKHGEFSVGTAGRDSVVILTYCAIDGMRYIFDRSTSSFFDGRPVR